MPQRVGQHFGARQDHTQEDVAVADRILRIRCGLLHTHPVVAVHHTLHVVAHEACGDGHLGKFSRVDVVHAVEPLVGVERDGLHERHRRAVDVERSVGQLDARADRAIVERAGRGVVVVHEPELAVDEGYRSPRSERYAHLIAVHAVTVVVVVVAFGIPLVDDELVGALHPDVDARRDELLGRGFQRRAVEAVGDLVVFPGVVVVSFGDLTPESFGAVGLTHARDDPEAFGFQRIGVGLEDQRLRFGAAAVEDLRGDLLLVVVEDDDVFGRHAFQRRDLGPGDFDRFVVAFDLRRVRHVDFQRRRAGGCEQGSDSQNGVLHHHDNRSFSKFDLANLRFFRTLVNQNGKYSI